MTGQSPPNSRRRLILIERLSENILPILVFIAALAIWEALVWVKAIPPYILPAPSRIATTLLADWETLSASLFVTLRITFAALFAAMIGGVGLAIIFTPWQCAERPFFTSAVTLFAALFLISVTGIAIFLAFSFLSHLLLGRWHESAHKGER